MEPFKPIPGKPPRKVVIDRQRKLFASLEIEELLAELVSKLLKNSNMAPFINRNSFIRRKIKGSNF